MHVEDGRHFLQTSSERWDVITGEPPPPKNTGIVSLYTRDYFQLVYDRLTEGGVNTYWLPVHNLLESDAKAIVKAYCEVFSDCSLWVGNGLDWMLLGSRGGKWSRAESEFARQWGGSCCDPRAAHGGPGASRAAGRVFIGDAAYLRELTRNTSRCSTTSPARDESRAGRPRHLGAYGSRMNPTLTRRRFEASDFIQEAWPEALRERTLPYFEYQGLLNRCWFFDPNRQRRPWKYVSDLHAVATRTPLRTLALWYLGTGVDGSGSWSASEAAPARRGRSYPS